MTYDIANADPAPALTMEPPNPIATVTQISARLGLEIAKGASDYADRHGLTTMRFDNHARLETAVLKRAKLSGFIVQAFIDSPISPLLKRGLPVVNVTNSRLELSLPRVAPDDEGVGRLAADYFINKGFTHFAFCGDEVSGASELRRRGFVGRCEASGYPVTTLYGNFALPVAYLKETKLKRLTAWLDKLETPVGVFGWTDSVCDTIINLCRAEHRQIPEEISVLGVNNDFARLADHPDFALSSIELDGHEIGYRAAEMLHRIISGQPGVTNAMRVLIPPLRLVERRSTDHYAVADAELVAALAFIKRNYHRPFQMEEVAHSAKLSRRVLEKRFRNKLKSSPYRETMRCRVERAKELLLTTDLKMHEIGMQCGYDTGSNFSLFFTDKVGCSPSAFRGRIT